MRRRLRRDEGDDEINLTPMLDIVFNMLIFFIVTASFAKESGVDVNRPGAVTAEIKIGTRRVISYFAYPLLRALDESFREP